MNHLLRMLWKRGLEFIRKTSLENTTPPVEHPAPSKEAGHACSLRVPLSLADQMWTDLRRPHAFAHERVGFLLAREAESSDGTLLLARRYEPLHEDEYLDDPTVGARINRDAIRRMLALALAGESIFHVHLHEHSGMPGFSAVDECNLRQLMPCFCSVGPRSIHGALLLSHDKGMAWGWKAGHEGPFPIPAITIVGSPLRRWEASP